MKKKKTAQEGLKIKGMFRLHIAEDGEIVGNSGWKTNIITNAGYLNILNQLGTGLTGVKMAYASLGTGTAPAAADITQVGELTTTGSTANRIAVTAATSSNSKTLINTVTFTSGVFTAAATIQNIGLWSTTGATNVGSLLAGNTYATSALATNQAVNATYQINFS